MPKHTKTTVPPVVAAEFAHKRVLIVGGDRRREQLARLRAAFPTTRFTWRPTSQHDTRPDAFARAMQSGRYDAAIVLWGLARHAHTKAARRLASELGLPLLWCHRPTAAAIVAQVQAHHAARGLPK